MVVEVSRVDKVGLILVVLLFGGSAIGIIGHEVSQRRGAPLVSWLTIKTVAWELRQTGIYSKQYVPVCPDCKNEVQQGSTKCKCGTTYEWRSFICPTCAGSNQCTYCRTLGRGS